MSIDPNGPMCYCGHRGCVESYISGAGAAACYSEKYGEKKSFTEIEAAYRVGEPRATEFMNFFFQKFGRSLANLLNILDPDIVVIGGGVSKFKSLYQEGVAEVAKQVFSDSLETPIVQNKLGDSAGVIGAALVGI
jgi:fructokinase